jgi:hypothetical protein
MLFLSSRHLVLAAAAAAIHKRNERQPENASQMAFMYSNLVGKLDQAGIPASAFTSLYRQKGKINPGVRFTNC